MQKLALSLVAVGSLVACGGGDSPSPTDMATNGQGTSYSLEFGPLTIPAGEERTKCITRRLGNSAAFYAGGIHDELGTGSHHMIVYKVNDTVEKTTPTDCQPFTDTLDPTKGSPIIITQKKDEVLTLPDGVAYAIDANQMIRLEVHYVNATAAPVTLTAKTTFVELPADKFKYAAGFLFVGNPDISIPANSKHTLGPSFFKMPAEYADVSFFAITGHEHHLGTNVTVSTANPDGTPDAAIYDVPNWLWSEPPTIFHQPEFKAPNGFTFTCEWNNTTNQTVKFGESTEQEMCFFWAYYYPDKGAKVCFHTDRVSGGLDICCPGGSPLCSAFGG